MTVKQAIQFGNNALRESSGSPLTDAKVLLQHVLGVERTELQRRLAQILTDGQFGEFRSLLSKRQSSEPIAYITGHREFYGLDFYVDRRVLIPRPETEQLVDAVLAELRGRTDEDLLFIDVGTGSGNIACAIAREVPLLTVIATDVSKAAVLVAKRNARNLEVTRQVDFRVGPFFEPVKPEEVRGKSVVIAANLPYVPARYQVMPELTYEPTEAIFPGESGVELYESFLEAFPSLGVSEAVILIEIHHDQAEAIRGIVSRVLPGATVDVRVDYSGHDRIVRIENRTLI